MTTWRCSGWQAIASVLVALVLGVSAGPASAQRAAVHRVDPTLDAYRSALETWMPAAAKESLQAIRLDRTAGAPAAPLAWIAADYAVRRYAATAMTALDHHPAAARLLALPAVTSPEAGAAALRELRSIIEQVQGMPARDRVAERSGLSALRGARRAVEEATLANRPTETAATPAEAAATSDEHARQALQIAAGAAEAAVRAGADRDTMIRFCVQNLTAMVDQARSRAGRPAR